MHALIPHEYKYSWVFWRGKKEAWFGAGTYMNSIACKILIYLKFISFAKFAKPHYVILQAKQIFVDLSYWFNILKETIRYLFV
jgi:hypothetical protein